MNDTILVEELEPRFQDLIKIKETKLLIITAKLNTTAQQTSRQY